MTFANKIASRPKTAFFVFCIAITAWRVLQGHKLGLPLSFDEAQYWQWSLTPAFGYFSKPPVVAWAIWLTTAVCGNGETCIRLGSALANLVTAGALYFVGRDLFGPRAGFWSGLLFLTLPGVSLSSILISTDPFLMMFWSLALLALIRAISSGFLGWWLACGVFSGFGLLSKYAFVAFVLCFVLYTLWNKNARKHYKQPGLWSATILAVVIYIPNFLWNMNNSFVSYEHTGANANLGSDLFHPLQALEFLGSQFGVFGPVPFAVLLFLAVRPKKTVSETLPITAHLPVIPDPIRFLLCFATPLIAIMTVEGFLSRANANWAAASYVAATPLVTGWLSRKHKLFWVRFSVVLHISLAAIAFNAPHIANLLGKELPKQLDPMKKLRGMDELGARITRWHNKYNKVPLVFDERKFLTPMLYYASPQNGPLYKWNNDGKIHDHYDLTTDMNTLIGQDVLVITRAPTDEFINSYFEVVSRVDTILLPTRSDYAHLINVFYAQNFMGYNR